MSLERTARVAAELAHELREGQCQECLHDVGAEVKKQVRAGYGATFDSTERLTEALDELLSVLK
jgi:hypothetical protein